MGAEQYLRMRQIADEVNYVAIEVDRLNRSIEGEFRRSVELKKYRYAHQGILLPERGV